MDKTTPRHRGVPHPRELAANFDVCQDLLRDRAKLDEFGKARLLQIAATDRGSSAVRAIHALLELPLDNQDDTVNEDDTAAALGLAIRFIEAQGYTVGIDAPEGADVSKGIRPVHDARISNGGSSQANDSGD